MGRMVFRENFGIPFLCFWERNEVIMYSPIKTLNRKEWVLWLGSLSAVIICNIMTKRIDLFTLVTTCIGVTALIFAAKGDVYLSWNVFAYVGMVGYYMVKEFF